MCVRFCWSRRRAISLNCPSDSAPNFEWCPQPEGVFEIGHRGAGFAFDNEGPRHRVFLEAFALANRLVTNAEYRAFIKDGGYQRAELWLDAVLRINVKDPVKG